jgi:hypothetical protein
MPAGGIMATESTTEASALALLHERATRQAIVDRLHGESIWSRFVMTLFAPVAASALFVLISTLWVHEGSRFVDAMLAVALTGVLVLAVGLAQLTRRLHALTVLLERSGTLSDFVAQADAKVRIG